MIVPDAPIPGPRTRLGILVPSTNSNAETLTAAILAGQPDIGVHYSRFSLPPSLEDAVDLSVLGEAPSLLADMELDAIAFHGTSGSWTGIGGDRDLCKELEAVTDAPATTASVATLEALNTLSASRVAVVFPGPAAIAAQIRKEYSGHGVEVAGLSVPDKERSNPEIAKMTSGEIRELIRPAFQQDVDAVVCVGTNLRSGYLVPGLEKEYGVPVVDSAVATLWHLLRIAGVERSIPGWGRLLSGD